MLVAMDMLSFARVISRVDLSLWIVPWAPTSAPYSALGSVSVAEITMDDVSDTAARLSNPTLVSARSKSLQSPEQRSILKTLLASPTKAAATAVLSSWNTYLWFPNCHSVVPIFSFFSPAVSSSTFNPEVSSRYDS